MAILVVTVLHCPGNSVSRKCGWLVVGQNTELLSEYLDRLPRISRIIIATHTVHTDKPDKIYPHSIIILLLWRASCKNIFSGADDERKYCAGDTLCCCQLPDSHPSSSNILIKDLFSSSRCIERKYEDCVLFRSPTHQIQIYNQYGQFVRKFGANILQHPRGVCVDNKGRIIVVECKVVITPQKFMTCPPVLCHSLISALKLFNGLYHQSE